MEFHHYSVLLNETIENLNIRPDGIYVDGTLGGGGHSYQILKRLGENGRLIGIDQDADAILAATERLKEYQDRVTIVRSNYCNMRQELKNLGIEKVDGIVLDLGVSSFQLDTPKRGFTYMEENAPLDMRMDQRESRTARDIVNTYSEKELYRIIRDFGEDKFAKNIAKHIVAAREKQPIETTGELTAIIRSAIPKKVQMSGGHPAKRTFQAIRIEVNQELQNVKNTLNDVLDLLDVGAIISVISFHSLEDRIVKHLFKYHSQRCHCEKNQMICTCPPPKLELVNKKPITASEEEISENPPSRSAKLRIARCIN